MELDILVAEKALGCKVVRYNDPMTSAGCECPDSRHCEYKNSGELKPYSSDLAAAFEVVEAMRADWFSFKAWQPAKQPHEPGDQPLECAVVSFICSAGPCPRHNTDFHNHHGAYDIQAETLPLAICKAALIALRVAPKDDQKT